MRLALAQVGECKLERRTLTVWSNEIIVSVLDMLADNINVEESLLDELFHTLVQI